jgi:hypothetical protein
MELRPFDLDRAKAGDKVVTRDGRPVRIVCFDKISSTGRPIIGLIKCCNCESSDIFKTNGKFLDSEEECSLDLFMLPKKVTKHFCVYKTHMFTNISYLYKTYEEMISSHEHYEILKEYTIDVEEDL